MLDFSSNLIDNNIRLADVLDIAIVAGLIWIALLWLSDRATQSLGLVIVLLAGIYLLARTLDMYLTAMLFQYGLIAAVFAVIVVFQQDIRNGIERLASSRWLRQTKIETSAGRTAETIAQTVAALASDRIGALMVLPGREPIARHVHGGVRVD